MVVDSEKVAGLLPWLRSRSRWIGAGADIGWTMFRHFPSVVDVFQKERVAGDQPGVEWPIWMSRLDILVHRLYVLTAWWTERMYVEVMMSRGRNGYNLIEGKAKRRKSSQSNNRSTRLKEREREREGPVAWQLGVDRPRMWCILC